MFPDNGAKNLMTFYGKCTALSEVIIVHKDEYRSTKNSELSSTIIAKYKNRTIKRILN